MRIDSKATKKGEKIHFQTYQCYNLQTLFSFNFKILLQSQIYVLDPCYSKSESSCISF